MGAQDYDFVLRCVEKTDAVYHIPKILYHWRAHMDSTAENPESKRYAFEAGRRAIQKHYERIGLKDAYVEETAYPERIVHVTNMQTNRKCRSLLMRLRRRNYWEKLCNQ